MDVGEVMSSKRGAFPPPRKTEEASRREESLDSSASLMQTVCTLLPSWDEARKMLHHRNSQVESGSR